MSAYDGSVTGAKFVGKQLPPFVAAIPFPIVGSAKIAKLTAPINIEEISGKRDGAVVIQHTSTGDKYHIAIATGSLPESPWHLTELDNEFTPV